MPMWVFTKEYVDKYNVPVDEIHSLEDLEPWLKVIKERMLCLCIDSCQGSPCGNISHIRIHDRSCHDLIAEVFSPYVVLLGTGRPVQHVCTGT